MDELISREALMRELIGLTIVSPEVMNYANAVAVAIEDAPIVEAEPVRHGRWIKEELVGCDPYYLCSVCGKLHNQDYNFCNNCGAKMDEGAENDYQGT